ncbi:MAG TPA: transketolase, partial [Gemmatimonadaceae bacterium]|nr:transketolase [Gemmatimonadaceae bacterium]
MVAAKPTVSTAELVQIARTLRLHVVKMIAAANSGHPGGSLSAVDIITALYFGRVLKHDPKNPAWPDRDRFILSKGHGVPALYAALAESG